MINRKSQDKRTMYQVPESITEDEVMYEEKI